MPAMKNFNPYHYQIDKVARPYGFSTVSVAAGEYYWRLTRAFVNSDQGDFYKYIDQLYGQFVGARFLVNQVDTFLVLIHQDSSADVYINNQVGTLARVLAKGDLRETQLVTIADIADVVDLRFDGIDIQKDDSVIYCFRSRWKFGLFFDFEASQEDGRLDVDRLYKDLASHYKYLLFQETYTAIQDETKFRELFDDGWFPFIQLLGGDYEKLSEIYQQTRNRKALLENFLETYDKGKIYSFVQYWWRKEGFVDKKDILLAGIEAYLTNSQTGYINCIKTLYSEIEGILRLAYYQEHQSDPGFAQLKKYVEDKANNKFVSANSLAFPDLLYRYFNEVMFKNFVLAGQDIELSRHSASHGVAESSKNTKERPVSKERSR